MAAKMFALFALLAFCASTTTATHVPWHLPPVTTLGAMNPCMQYCMMQQPFAMNPCMQYCTTQQAFAMGRFASPASMMLQQPWTLPFQQYWTPRMMPFQQCHCGAISQIMQQQQLPSMFNPMATAIPPMFFQQPFAGVPF
ncbi:10 kDa prolamin [Setaria italica]|uniref:Bifunctional inhibitor/plant lipid transfer protein/seed storage helical domain-containing protein n=2 Tax=Setaria TaxID=4554 RepID=K3XZW2_SETIT|nr:10 kDa prolamin [Setaria italica]XP_034592436.1 10 kDa prolamin-like [Setaria viridis]TKW21275.1 hypothetical protein SEVIR_4G169900v2 [Setaria viridis]